MKKKIRIHVIAALAIMFVFGLAFTMESKATSGHYEVFLSLVDQSTGKTVSNPNATYTFYAEDGSVIDTGNYDNAAYFNSDTYSSYYYSGSDMPVKVRVELDGWIFETNVYDIVFEDSGTSGVVECRMTIPVWPDTSIDTLTIQAGFQKGTSASERTGKTIQIRKTGEKEFSQTATTDDTGMVTFADLPLGAYDVYCVEQDKYYYIYPSSTGERYVYFNTSTYTHYFKLTSSFSKFGRYFEFEMTAEDGTVVEPYGTYNTNWKLPGGSDYYLTTTSVPDGYTGEVFDHVPVIRYTNLDEMEFNVEFEMLLYSMDNSNYNISSSDDSFKASLTASDADADLLGSFTEFRYKRMLKGTTLQDDVVEVAAEDTKITDVNVVSEQSSELIKVSSEEIKVQKADYDNYQFVLTANVDGEEFVTPVTIMVGDSENVWVPGVIDESTLKVTKASNSVSMSWTAPNEYVDYYKVCRYNASGTLLKEYKVNGTSFKHTGLTSGKAYKYVICCMYYLAEDDEYTHTLPTEREVKLITLKAVTNAKASNNKMNSLKLSWGKVTNAAGYQVKRLNNAGTTLKTMTTTSLSLTDTSLKAATKYTYQIRPYYLENGVKKFGPVKTIKTATICKAPAAPTLKAGTKSMKVSFKKVTGASGYEIAYSTSTSFTAKTTKKVTVTGTSATISKTIKNLTKGKTYYVKVRAYVKTATGSKVYTSYSTRKSVKVK